MVLPLTDTEWNKTFNLSQLCFLVCKVRKWKPLSEFVGMMKLGDRKCSERLFLPSSTDPSGAVGGTLEKLPEIPGVDPSLLFVFSTLHWYLTLFKRVYQTVL